MSFTPLLLAARARRAAAPDRPRDRARRAPAAELRARVAAAARETASRSLGLAASRYGLESARCRTLVDEQPAAPEREPRADQAARRRRPGAERGRRARGASPSHPCPNCGAPMGPGQEWCLQCGAGAPGSARAPALALDGPDRGR